MFARAMHFATAPLRFVNAEASSRNYVDCRAPRAIGGSRARFARPDAQKPNCLWEVNKTGGERRRSSDGLCARQNAQFAVEMRNERLHLRFEFARLDGRRRTVDGRASRASRDVA